MVVTAQTVDLRGMAVLLLLTSPPRTLRAVGGGSAAGSSHSRHVGAHHQVVLAQGLGHEDCQAPRDEEGDRGAGTTAGRGHHRI